MTSISLSFGDISVYIARHSSSISFSRSRYSLSFRSMSTFAELCPVDDSESGVSLFCNNAKMSSRRDLGAN